MCHLKTNIQSKHELVKFYRKKVTTAFYVSIFPLLSIFLDCLKKLNGSQKDFSQFNIIQNKQWCVCVLK